MTTTATRDEYQQIADYLVCHGQLRNESQIGEIWRVLHGGGKRDWSTLVHRRAGEIVGVMARADDPEPAPWREHQYDLEAEIEADDGEAALALLDTLPAGKLVRFIVYSPQVQTALDRVPDIERYPIGPRLTVTEERFRPVATEGIREVTSADAALFEGLEPPPWDSEGKRGGRHFALVRDGRARSRAAWIPFTMEPVFSPSTIGITYVATEGAHRRQGLGRQVVSYVTELVLRAGARPMYWTSEENIASQALAKSLGYEEFAHTVCYVWRTPRA